VIPDLGSQHNAVSFDAADRDVFVFFTVDRFEVVSERDQRETKDQNEANRNAPRGMRHWR
jgi:hypothetical protein